VDVFGGAGGGGAAVDEEAGFDPDLTNPE